MMMIRSMLAAAAFAALPLAMAVPRAHGQEAEVVEILEAVERLGSADLWPGFDPSRTPIAIYDGARTWLYRHPSPPPDFAAQAVPGLHSAPGQHDRVRANTAVEIAGVMTATLLLQLLEDFPTTVDRAGVALHEAFHAYQKTAHPEWGRFGMGLENPDSDAGLLALRRLETDLLRRAVAALDDGEAAALAAAALAARAARFSALPAAAVRFERGLELVEGTAQHVQLMATGSRAGLMTLPEGGFPADELFMRNYATGLAWATLLQRLRPGWEAVVESGAAASLDEALAAAVARVEPADWRTGEATALRRAEEDVAVLLDARAAQRASFMDQQGWQITVETAPASPLALRGLDPANLARLGGAELLHTRWVRLGHGSGEIEVLGRPALTAGIGDEPFSAGFARITITGIAAEPEIERAGGVLVLRADGIEARFDDAGLDRDELARRIVVRLPHPETG
jgi:hypothetical protein